MNLPAAFPWGVAIIAIEDGRVCEANGHMNDLYRCAAGDEVDTIFYVDESTRVSSVISDLAPGESWSGRIFPRNSRHGISSVDVMLQREADEASRVWLTTLEHPKVNDSVRYSSRSELKMLSVLLDNTLEYIYFRDVDGRFILTNKAFREAVSRSGKTPDVDNMINDFVSEDSAQWFAELDQQISETGNAVVNEVSKVGLTCGLEHWLQLSIVPVRNGEGDLIGTLSVARDISDLKRTEESLHQAIDQARAASTAKGEFLAAMSHEIRTPINGMIGASELCEETDLDKEQRSYINTVLECGNTLLSLVNDVLDFSKIEAGQLNLEKLNFEPHILLENVAEGFSQEARKKGVELITSYDEDLPDYLMGDPTRLKQILNNLVSNAVKFTDQGEIVIHAETFELKDNSARIRFSVKDTGIGITEARKEAIFDSFTQEDMSTTRKYGGTGLGLTISRELVQLMEGEISVASQLGQGSTFTFEVPFELSYYHGAEAVPYNPELAGMRVLIVDDNETNRNIYSQMCVGWGYRAFTAEEGTVALSMMEQGLKEGDAYDLVMLDQQMPGLSGLDVASLIKTRPDLRQTRMILLSSSLDRNEDAQATELGVARALSKPVKRDTLLEVILETFEMGEDRRLQDDDKVFLDVNVVLDILVVEDNPVNQTVAKQRLSKLGHKVTLAENGVSALEKVRQKHFDCILMDIEMPGMDGLETTAAIRKFENSNKIEPHYIVAMTAHAMKGDEERCLKSGMNNYISKPFRAARLKVVLNQAAHASRGIEESLIEHHSDFAGYVERQDWEDREDLIIAAEVFLETAQEDIAKLKQALEVMDYEQCYFLAHSFKGIVGIFGQDAYRTIAESLEKACKKESEHGVQALAEQFIKAVQILCRDIELELKKRKH